MVDAETELVVYHGFKNERSRVLKWHSLQYCWHEVRWKLAGKVGKGAGARQHRALYTFLNLVFLGPSLWTLVCQGMDR